MKQKKQVKKYFTKKKMIIPKGTEISDNGDGNFQMVIGHGNDFAELVRITDMEGLFAEGIIKED